MAALFPQAAACQENVTGPIEIPDHLLVRQTINDTLHEALDVDGVRALLERIESGEVTVHCCDTTEPSVLAHEIITAAAVRVPRRRGVPEPADERGAAPARARRRPHVDRRARARRDRAGARRGHARAHHAPTTCTTCSARSCSPGPATSGGRAGPSCVDRGRGQVLEHDGHELWCTTERHDDARQALAGDEPDGRGGAARPPRDLRASPPSTRWPRRRRCRRRGSSPGSRCSRTTASRCRAGTPAARRREWVARRLLARMHSYSRRTRRDSTRAVTAQDFMRFLLRWQHVAPGHPARRARPGSLAVLDQLQGFEAAAVAWEPELLARAGARLPARAARPALPRRAGRLAAAHPAAARRRRRAGRAAVEGHADLGGVPRRHPVAARGGARPAPTRPEPTVGATAEILEVLRERGRELRGRARGRDPPAPRRRRARRSGTASRAACSPPTASARCARRVGDAAQARAAPVLAAVARRADRDAPRPGRWSLVPDDRRATSTATSWPRRWPSCCCAAGA